MTLKAKVPGTGWAGMSLAGRNGFGIFGEPLHEGRDIGDLSLSLGHGLPCSACQDSSPDRLGRII